MGRHKKYTDGQVKEMVEYAISVITSNGKYPLVPTFSRMDAYQAASKEYENLAYSDIRDDIFTKVKNAYLKNQEVIWGPLPSQMRSPVELDRMMNPRLLLAKYKENPQKLEEELVKWADVFNHNANMVVDLSCEIRKMKEELFLKQSDGGILEKENEELKLQNQLLQNKYDEAKSELEKYKDTIKELENIAGLMVIKDCHMGSVDLSGEEEETVSLAKQLTYLKEKNKEKQDAHEKRIFKLQGKSYTKE